MKSFAILFAAAGLVAAQNVYQGVPECAMNCLEESVPDAGCDLDDTACQCSSDFMERLTPIISPCLVGACSADEIQQAIDAAGANCAQITGGSSSSSPAPTATSTGITRPGNSTMTRTSTSTSKTSSPTSGSGNDDSSDGSGNNDGNSDAPGAAAALAPAIGGIVALMLGWVALL